MIFLLLSMLVVIFVGFLLKRALMEKIVISDYGRKAILITGCDSGFGYDLALRCLSHGMTVFATCLTEEGCQNLRMHSHHMYGHLDTFVMDVRSEMSIAAAFNHVKSSNAFVNKGLYGLVNNAGITCAPLPDDLLTIDEYKKVADVNVFGAIRVTHAFKDMIKEQRGRIVIITSACSRVAIPYLGPYTVSKFALDAYCDILRRELSAFGISVCAIEPGFFSTTLVSVDRITNMLDNGWNKAPEEQRKQYGEEFLTSLKRCTSSFLGWICSQHTERVIDAYFHALTSKFPRIRYYVGNDMLFGFLPLSYLPSSVTDKLLLNIAYIHGAPKPSVLKT